MLLRQRISLLFGAALLATLAGVALPAALILADREARVDALWHRLQAAEFAAALDVAAVPLAAAAQRLAATPAIAEAVAASDQRALRAALPDAEPELLLDFVTARGDLLLALPARPVDRPLARAAPGPGLSVRVQRDPARPERLLLLAAVPLPQGGAVLAAAALAPRWPAIGAALGAPLFLRAPDGALHRVSGDGAAEPSGTGAARLLRAAAGLDTRRAIATTLTGPAGEAVGTLVALRDTREEDRREAVVVLAALLILLLLLPAFALLLWRTTRAALDPLLVLARALRRLAAGDIFASAGLPPRRDELGDIAAAVERLRDTGLSLDRMEQRVHLDQLRQLDLVRAEMLRILEVLDGEDRAAMEALLRRAESGDATRLADAFRDLASEVIAKHRQLATLLDERTRDLATVREALAEREALARLRQEMEFARRFQLSALPTHYPYAARLDLHAAMLPAREVGGDTADVVDLGRGRVAVLIGDASGKGVPAALFIATTRILLRAALARGDGPAEALRFANAALAADNPTLMFATAFLGVLDVTDGAFRYACAGHNPPRLLTAAGEEQPLHAPFGIALGVDEDAAFTERTAALAPGDMLLLFTDGVSEAFDPAGEAFGDARLAGALARARGRRAAEVNAAVTEAVERFADGAEQADDITLLALALRPRTDHPGAGATPDHALA